MKKINLKSGICYLAIVCCLLGTTPTLGQQTIQINAAMLDGVEINKMNILDFQILSTLTHSLNAKIQGKLTFRQGGYTIQFTANQRLNPGMNQMNKTNPGIQWQYSSPALRELFTVYNQLPAGMYQYCVEVIPLNTSGEHDMGNRIEECLYQKNPELFMIQLLDPENNAKLYEYNPMLAWVANYSLSSDLTYKLKVAEIQKGQTTVTAIQRNNPIFQETGLRQNTLIYPGYAKPLVAYQPYAWTVDAYYKGMLLGSAEPWRFVILEDSLDEAIPKETYFLDIEKETGGNRVYAIGTLKLRYLLQEYNSDTLTLTLNQDENEIPLKKKSIFCTRGDNRLEIDFLNDNPLKHGKLYRLTIQSQFGKSSIILFRFINPDFL